MQILLVRRDALMNTSESRHHLPLKTHAPREELGREFLQRGQFYPTCPLPFSLRPPVDKLQCLSLLSFLSGKKARPAEMHRGLENRSSLPTRAVLDPQNHNA